MVVPVFRDTLTVRPGSSPGGFSSAFTQLRNPPSIQEQIQARQAGVALDPQTGRILGTISSEKSPTKRAAQQDFQFAKALGGLTTQLGLSSPRASGVALRPEQIGSLIALRRGDDPAQVLGTLGRSAAPLPTRGLGGAGGFSLNGMGEPMPMLPGLPAPAEGGSGGPGPLGLPMPVLLGAAALAALLLLRR